MISLPRGINDLVISFYIVLSVIKKAVMFMAAFLIINGFGLVVMGYSCGLCDLA